MEPPLENGLQNQLQNDADLIGAASYFAHDALSQCTDVSTMAFAVGHKPPTEQMLSAVATIIRNIVLGIENAIIGDHEYLMTGTPVSWPLLLQSGFLRDTALVDFALSVFAAERLNTRILANGEIQLVDQLPAQLLVHKNALIAAAAQSLLANETEIRRSPQLIHRQMNSELLHKTTWRIVAALQVIGDHKNVMHIANSKSFLNGHDETNSLHASARKIVFFLNGETDDLVLNPAHAGTAIFAAALSAKAGLDQDHVLRLIDGHSSAPLALLLRACEVHRDAAMETICLFKGFDLTPLEVISIERYYDVITVSDANTAIAQWGAERMRLLTFPEASLGNR